MITILMVIHSVSCNPASLRLFLSRFSPMFYSIELCAPLGVGAFMGFWRYSPFLLLVGNTHGGHMCTSQITSKGQKRTRTSKAS